MCWQNDIKPSEQDDADGEDNDSSTFNRDISKNMDEAKDTSIYFWGFLIGL